MKTHAEGMRPNKAMQKLKHGNEVYQRGAHPTGDFSAAIRACHVEGQEPFAIVITCSDSRVVPEAIFNVSLGDLFVIRIAGNVIDNHQLGSIEYAAGHLGCNLLVVLGHDHCGAVDAAINHDPDGYIKFITDEISQAIGDETDEVEACKLNVRHSLEAIEGSLEIQKEEKAGLQVVGALYHLEDGSVEWLD